MSQIAGRSELDEAQSTRYVLLLVETSTAYGRACAHGIARYARNHGRWMIRHMPHNEMPTLNPDIPWKWDWTGMIGRIANRRVQNLVQRLKLPTVDIMGMHPMKGVVVVDADHRRIVELAIEHLLHNGLKHIGFCGVPGLAFSDMRERMFGEYRWPHAVTHEVYAMPRNARGTPKETEQRWLRDLRSLRSWVERLPKPVGIVACNDTRARHVVEVCMAAGLNVPRDVCVVGVDNDDVPCELSAPSLSSVDPNAETIGFEAAKLLDHLMSGRKPPRKPLLIPPLGVERRDSSNVQSFDDPDLNEAIRFVLDHAHEGINVGTVVAHVGTSRSTLERRFREHLQCSLHEYIHARRMERVQRLLLETNYPASKIARIAGFGTSSYFTAAFRKHAGMTPGQYRQHHAGETSA